MYKTALTDRQFVGWLILVAIFMAVLSGVPADTVADGAGGGIPPERSDDSLGSAPQSPSDSTEVIESGTTAAFELSLWLLLLLTIA